MIVLLSPVGGQAMHGIIEYFKERGDRVIGIDWNPEAIGRHFVDRFHVVPRVQDVQYPDAILDIIRKEKVDVFIGWLDPEILFWNKQFMRRHLPSEIARVHTFNFRPDLLLLYDKLECAKRFKQNGFVVPKTPPPSNYVRPGFPWIVKPRLSTGSRSVMRIDNAAAWESCPFRGKGGFIVQQLIPGREYTVDFFAVKGKIVNAVARERLEHQGVSLRGKIVSSSAILKIVKKIAYCFYLDGLNNIQFIKQAGQYYAIDFNPRPSGTIMLSVRAGVDLLNNLIERKEGKPLTVYGGPRKVKMVRYLKEHYYD